MKIKARREKKNSFEVLSLYTEDGYLITQSTEHHPESTIEMFYCVNGMTNFHFIAPRRLYSDEYNEDVFVRVNNNIDF